MDNKKSNEFFKEKFNTATTNITLRIVVIALLIFAIILYLTVGPYGNILKNAFQTSDSTAEVSSEQADDNKSKEENKKEDDKKDKKDSKKDNNKDSNKEESSSSSNQGSHHSSSSNKGQSSSSGSSSNKVWVPPVYKTVHHEAVYETVKVCVCNFCGAEFSSVNEFLAHKNYYGG